MIAAALTTFSFLSVFIWLLFIASVVLTLAHAAGKFPNLWVPFLLFMLFVVLVLAT